MRGTSALNPNGVPHQYFIEQAHGALMGNVTFNPMAV
jgi:hypothetical protein